MIRWKRPGNWRCLWRICHELMHAGNSVDSAEILGALGAAGPSDRRDTRAKAYMPSSPNGVKELNSLSFMGSHELSDIASAAIG